MLDPKAMNRIYYVPEVPDLVFSDAGAKRRAWGDNVQYYTGAGCIAGALAARDSSPCPVFPVLVDPRLSAGFFLGAAKGSVDAVRTRHELPAGADSSRLLLNRFLNMSGGAGRKTAMALGE